MPKKELKSRLHSRNKNRERYDLTALIAVTPELKDYVKLNKHGDESVEFSNPKAVKLLNQALLHHYYGITSWEFPDVYLTPPIPGRADYLHHVADLLGGVNFGRIPEGDLITVFDIGVGANCIYPTIGVVEYGWNFIGSDINPESLAIAEKHVEANPVLHDKIELELQPNSKDAFYGVIAKDELIDVAICNPPFHASKEDAAAGTRRKIKNLTGEEQENPELNFSGIHQELVCLGGELSFIINMIRESERYALNCFWFTTLVSKQSNVRAIQKVLRKHEVTEMKTIPMGTGNKSSRLIAWSFLTKEDQKEWRKQRWDVKNDEEE